MTENWEDDKPPRLLLGLLSKPNGVNNHHWKVGLHQFVTNVIQQVSRDEDSSFAFFWGGYSHVIVEKVKGKSQTFNSYYRLILNSLRRPDKLFLLFQSTVRIGPGNHTFRLSSFLSLLFVLNSVMTPPLYQVNTS